MKGKGNYFNRCLSFVLALVMMFSLVPVLRQDADAVYSNDNNFKLTLSPIYGNAHGTKGDKASATTYRVGTASQMSISGTIYYFTNKTISWEESCTGFMIDASAVKGYEGKVNVYLGVAVNGSIEDVKPQKDPGIPETTMPQMYAFEQEFVENLSENLNTYNVVAVFCDAETNEELSRLSLSVEARHARKATTTSVRFKGVGFQIRVANGHPLGPNDYTTHYGADVTVTDSLPFDENQKEKNGELYGLYVDRGSGTDEYGFPAPVSANGADRMVTFKAASNVRGADRSESTWKDTKVKDYALYHMMHTNDIDGSVYSVVNFSDDELLKFNDWLNKIYLEAPEVKSGAFKDTNLVPGNTITVAGPRIICCYNGLDGFSQDNDKTTEYYNLKYYASWTTKGYSPNNYDKELKKVCVSSWSDWRYVSFVLPTSNLGSITINCYDASKCKDGEPNPDALIYQFEALKTDSKFSNDEKIAAAISNVLGRTVSDDGIDYYQITGTVENLISSWKSGSVFDVCNVKDTDKTLSEKLMDGQNGANSIRQQRANAVFLKEEEVKPTDAQKMAFLAHERMAGYIKGTISSIYSSESLVKKAQSMIAYKEINIPTTEELSTLTGGKQFVFDHGFIDDCMVFFTDSNSNGTYAEATPLTSDVTKATVLTYAYGRSANVDLFYMPNGNCQYTVKVRIDGVEKPELEKTYPKIVAGTVINKENVTIPPLPPKTKVVDITPESLTVDETPDDNIIIIDAATTGQYTVKVRIDGVEQPDLERTYDDAPIGSTIEASDVIVPELPDGLGVTNIENVPLVIDNTPEDNIIIIDAGEVDERAKYKVMYYLDGVLKETEEYEDDIGTVISEACQKSYPGYTLDHEEGTPFTLVDNSSVVRIYFVKQWTGEGSSSSAKLYTDQNYTKEPSKDGKKYSYASGYGFYSLFTAEVPKWIYDYFVNGKMPEKITPYRYNQSGCHGRAIQYLTPQYKYNNMQAQAYATWTDGLSAGKISENGTSDHSTKVKMVLEKAKCYVKSGRYYLVWSLPKNTASPERTQKAYIPVGWKNGNYWRINYVLEYQYDEFTYSPDWYTGTCRGHRVRHGSKKTGYWYTTEHYPPTLCTRSHIYITHRFAPTGYAQIYVSGSMYDDDFTADRK